MRYLYICPTCKKVYSAESEQPDEARECLVCEKKLIYANCTREEWDQKSEEEKKSIKEAVLQHNQEIEMSTDVQMLRLLNNLDKNLSTIKGILVFFTVVFVICVIVVLIMTAKSVAVYNDILDSLRYGF